MLVTNRQWCVRIAAVGVLCAALAAGRAAGNTDRQLPDAAKNRDWATVGALLDRGVDVDTPQGDGATALHWAARWNDLRAVNRLLEAGADVDAANELGATPLWVACASRNTEVVERLLAAGANANRGLLVGETLLMRCTATGDPVAVEALIEHGARVDATEPENGQTALMWAAAHREPDVVRVLLKHGAATDARTVTRRQFRGTGLRSTTSPAGATHFGAGGFTPLLFAARHGDVASARLLLNAGADVDGDRRGRQQRAGAGHHERSSAAGGVPARPRRQSQRGRRRLHRVARGDSARRPLPGENAAGPGSRPGGPSHPEHPGAALDIRVRLHAQGEGRHAVPARGEVPSSRSWSGRSPRPAPIRSCARTTARRR